MIKQEYPLPTVAALIVNPQGKVFLMKTHKWRGMYAIPGGKVEAGEILEQALKREVKEETNLDIYDLKFQLLQEFIYDDAFYKKRHFIFLDFSAKTKSTQVKLNDEAEQYIWVMPKQALKMNVDKYTKNLIRKYLEN